MELKRVSNATVKNYAKKEQVTKKELKNTTPHKWIVASSTGIVTLFYTSHKRSIHQIGVVFGCVEIAHNYNYTPLFNSLNSVMDVFYYCTWILGISFILSVLIGIFRNEDEEKHKKMVKLVKTLLIVGIISAIITGILIFILSQDIPAFYEGGVKIDLGY